MSTNDTIHSETADIEAAASNLIDRFGADAARQATIRAAELRQAGDDDGYALWLEISTVVAEMAEKKTVTNGQAVKMK